MDFDYFSVDAILAENQVTLRLDISWKLKLIDKHRKSNVHLSTLSPAWVILEEVQNATYVSRYDQEMHPTWRFHRSQSRAKYKFRSGWHTRSYTRKSFSHYIIQYTKFIYRDWAEFNIPTPFGSRVRNALKAEACSVRLSNLVGAGGLWYGFGKTIMDMYVGILVPLVLLAQTGFRG